MSLLVPSIRGVDMTPAHRRTVEKLIGRGRAPPFDPSLAERVRTELDERLADAGIVPGREVIWLGKHRLNDHQRCEGLFESTLLRERPGFEYSPRTAAGALFLR